MRYTYVIFDLDGTLLNTLEDLHRSVNMTLAEQGFPLRSIEEVKSFVGNGVAKLMALSLPEGTPVDRESYCLARFKEIYAQNCACTTKPYPYIEELLAHLKAAGVGVAIVSNKFDHAVKALAQAYFPGLVDVAVGERECDGVRKKPYPDTVFEAMRYMGAEAMATAYVGDSEVDILTAKYAGIPCLSVTWGFREATYLREQGATYLFDTAEALEAYLLG